MQRLLVIRYAFTTRLSVQWIQTWTKDTCNQERYEVKHKSLQNLHLGSSKTSKTKNKQTVSFHGDKEAKLCHRPAQLQVKTKEKA